MSDSKQYPKLNVAQAKALLQMQPFAVVRVTFGLEGGVEDLIVDLGSHGILEADLEPLFEMTEEEERETGARYANCEVTALLHLQYETGPEDEPGEWTLLESNVIAVESFEDTLQI